MSPYLLINYEKYPINADTIKLACSKGSRVMVGEGDWFSGVLEGENYKIIVKNGLFKPNGISVFLKNVIRYNMSLYHHTFGFETA